MTVTNGDAQRDARLTRWLRTVVWGGAAFVWLVPLGFRLFADLPWTTGDFVAWGVMLLVAAGLAEAGLRLSGKLAYRAGMIVAVGTSFLITWSNLAVGIIGDENNPLNQIFFGVIAIALIGSFLVRFRAKGMAAVMVATAVVQFGTGFLALAYEHIVFGIVGVFALGWLLAAWLFREAARGEAAKVD
ncbi:MAG TPA: hypothetical protein VFF66_01690 [Brevundimonas sp.]|nr:hypothetical protein [Brevundimonas sp.]